MPRCQLTTNANCPALVKSRFPVIKESLQSQYIFKDICFSGSLGHIFIKELFSPALQFMQDLGRVHIAIPEQWSDINLFRFNFADISGVEINARPLARGEWKPRGMSRIFAEVVRRASWLFFFFRITISWKEFVSFLSKKFEGYSLGDNSYEGAQSNINGDEVRV